MLKDSPPELNIVVAYLCVSHGTFADCYSSKFTQTYLDNPAGYPHKLVIICNGGELPPTRKKHFEGLDCEFLLRANDPGKDISGFQHAALEYPCDLLVCFGESICFHRPDWLLRLAEARLRHGPGMYGCFSSHYVRAHLNTNGFATDPDLLNKFPFVTSDAMRYDFEHGPGCYWQRLWRDGRSTMLVTFDGEWGPGEWRLPDNIMHKGDQSNCLVWCRHTENWKMSVEPTKSLWQSQSNMPFHL